jgi:uncharacterized coiled-coil DUF342 family protein
MSDVLTREQLGQTLTNAVDHGTVDDEDYKAIMDHDAALRAQLANVTAEREAAKDIVRKIAEGVDPVRACTEGMASVLTLQQQLAQMTVELRTEQHKAETNLYEADKLRQQLEQVTMQFKQAQTDLELLGQAHQNIVFQSYDLRDKIAQLKMEMRERAKDCMEHCQDQTRSQLGWNAAKRQLAQVTAERDQYKQYADLANKTAGDIGTNYKQQLAERDARIAALQEQVRGGG